MPNVIHIEGTRRLVRHMPSLEHVAAWVEQAARLPRVVSY